MTGEALVCRLKNLEPIEDADNLVKAEMYGETIIISKDYEEGQLGLLFDCETQLSHKYAHFNNLYRHSELNSDQKQEGYFDDNRRVRPIRLRGVKCSGFWMPIESLDNIDEVNLSKDSLEEGTQITAIQGVDICKKYKKGKSGQKSGSSKSNKSKKKTLADRVQNFYEHFKTGHFFRNIQKIKEGDLIIFTEKLHGTSCRCGRVPVKIERSWWEQLLADFSRLAGNKVKDQEYGFVVGSRRVIKSVDGVPRNGVNHYYSEDLWTKEASKHFEGKLDKGETVYFEIVGYTDNGAPIMGTHSNNKLKSFMDKKEFKEFKNKYGEQTQFSYGCVPNPLGTTSDLIDIHHRIVDIVDERGNHSKKKHGHYSQLVLEEGDMLHIDSYNKALTLKNKEGAKKKYYGMDFGGFNTHASKEEYLDLLHRLEDNVQRKVFVYRITQTTPNGDTIDYSWDQVKKRCEELGVNHVPELDKDIFPEGFDIEILEKRIKFLTNNESTQFPQHIREGICIRIEDGSLTPTILKNKGFLFRVMEGQIKDQDDYEDMEENN